MKKLISLAFLCYYSYTGMGGIYRHDVPVEKYKALAAQSQFDCVGEIMKNATQLEGSCVLIGRKYVLSAAHCFIKSDTEKDTMTVGNNKVTVYKQVNTHVADISTYYFRFKRRLHPAKAIIIIHPAYLDKDKPGKCDLALIELSEEVKDIDTALLCTSFDELHSIVTGVGYGASGLANNPEDVGMYMEKIAGQNVIDTFEGYKLNGQPTIISCDFDHPTNKELNQMGSADAQPLEYICSGGDSGGGLFRQTKRGWQLTGICSGAGTNVEMLLQTGYYGQTMNWTRISVLAGWIKKEIAHFEQQVEK